LPMQPSDFRIRRGSALSAKADASLSRVRPPGPPRSFSDRDARVGVISREEKPRGMWRLRVRLGLRKRARKREIDDVNIYNLSFFQRTCCIRRVMIGSIDDAIVLSY